MWIDSEIKIERMQVNGIGKNKKIQSKSVLRIEENADSLLFLYSGSALTFRKVIELN